MDKKKTIWEKDSINCS